MTRMLALLCLVGASCADPEPSTQQAALSAPAVPVLTPGDRNLERTTFRTGRDWFALTGRDHGATVHVEGNRAAKRVPGIDPISGNRPLRGTRGFVTTNEGIRTATWIEGGVAYSLDVECSDSTDARCQDDAYLLDLVSHLVVRP